VVIAATGRTRGCGVGLEEPAAPGQVRRDEGMLATDSRPPRRHLSRRGFLQAFALLSGGLALSAACGQQAPAAKPAEPAKPAESKPAAPAATTAPAAAPAAKTESKPAEAAKPAAGGEAPKKGGILRVGLTTEVVTMDPNLSGSKFDRMVYHNIYEPLVTLDTKLQIKPGLAESWTQPDPKTIVFKLRQGVKFHDGTDFDADAVKFNFDRMQDPASKSVRTGEIANVQNAEVVDKYTVKLNLKKPDAALLATLTDRAGMVVSPDAIKKLGPDLARKPVGTGPFEFVEWVKDDHLTAKRFEGYWGKDAGPYLDQIRYRPIPDDTVKLQSLVSGEIDFMDYVQPRDVAGVKANSSLVEIDIPSLAAFGYQLNMTRPPFDNKALRLAVAHGIDNEAITKGVWLGVGSAANGPISPASWAYDAATPPIKRDVAKAKQYLAEAGKPDGFTFTLTIGQTPIGSQEAEAIKAMLAEVGITVEIQIVDPARGQADGNARNFDMTSYAWSGRPDPDGNTFQFFKTQPGTGLNWAGYSNPKVDEILDKTREVSDQAERKKLYSELVKILQADSPWVFIVHPVEPKAFSPKVQNYDPVPDGMMRFRDVWMK
jgi:peptide/nickel transport system substrate-binding protein